MKVAIASDHAGWDIKETVCSMVSALGHEVEDYGPSSSDCVDYPDFAEKVSRAVQDSSVERGILICGSGIGMSMVTNRFDGVRAVVAVMAVIAMITMMVVVISPQVAVVGLSAVSLVSPFSLSWPPHQSSN